MAAFSMTAIAQKPSDNNDPVYGYDPLLYNGRVYYFYPLPGTGGTQYLYGEFDTRGSIIVRGIKYSNLSINYDIYNQQLVLKYTDNIGSTKLIEISKAWLESFILGGSSFEIITNADSTQRIYQVIGSDNVKVLYYRSKDLEIDNAKGAGSRSFTGVRKEMYVLINHRLINFKNNGSFIKAFSPAEQDLIKIYIRKHSINVRKANDFIMTDLINYCNKPTGS